ncbi:hypothetical protein ACFOKF_17175 [Sphingobium rhizovicinum]|uniref:Uncharacterized protein n=1 Tax=Sphingobium rhizovicinum TaxID=432308 RepID=A0ABV7NHG1_9SPHN
MKRLYVIVGFDDADVERQASDLQRQYEAGTVRFLARAYPARADKRATYLKSLVQSANDLIFGSTTATNFCRKQDQPCAVEAGNGGGGKKRCERATGIETGCARQRPQLVVIICADQLFDDVFDRLGRGALILRIAGPKLPQAAALKAAIDAFEPIASQVVLTISNRAKALYAPLMPDRNFQRLGGHGIARDAQADPSRFAAILQEYHAALYRGDFANPKKRQIRGAYMLDSETAFQQDRLHNTVQIIGPESRQDGFHLLNAYHIYGVKTDPGLHFDVMNADGGAINHTLDDVLTGKQGGGAEKHLNATPCDRLL